MSGNSKIDWKKRAMEAQSQGNYELAAKLMKKADCEE